MILFLYVLNFILFIYSEAVETRHALHGVRWPASNPKCLIVEFARDIDMEKAILSTLEEVMPISEPPKSSDAKSTFGWSKADTYKNDTEEKKKVMDY